MRRRILALVTGLAFALAGALLSAGPSAGRVPLEERATWSTLPYYGYDSTHYYAYVPTNAELWKARRITNTFTALSPTPATPELYGGKVLEAVWKKTCPATKAQTVQFTRKVRLPGPVDSLRATLKTVDHEASMHQGKNPFAWAELWLGEKLLVRLDAKKTPLDTWVAQDLDGAAVDVAHGVNELTVVAKKRKTKKSWGFCSSQKQPSFGVAAELYALPAADASSSIPTGTFSGVLEATVTNAGPSDLSDNQFAWRSTYPTGSAYVVEAVGLVEGGSCNASQNSEGWLVTCTLPELRAGESVVVQVGVQLANATCPGTWKIPFNYHVHGLWDDPNLANNGQGDRYLACPA